MMTVEVEGLRGSLSKEGARLLDGRYYGLDRFCHRKSHTVLMECSLKDKPTPDVIRVHRNYYQNPRGERNQSSKHLLKTPPAIISPLFE